MQTDVQLCVLTVTACFHSNRPTKWWIQTKCQMFGSKSYFLVGTMMADTDTLQCTTTSTDASEKLCSRFSYIHTTASSLLIAEHRWSFKTSAWDHQFTNYAIATFNKKGFLPNRPNGSLFRSPSIKLNRGLSFFNLFHFPVAMRILETSA